MGIKYIHKNKSPCFTLIWVRYRYWIHVEKIAEKIREGFRFLHSLGTVGNDKHWERRLIPRLLETVVRDDKVKDEILKQVQNDGKVESRLSAATSDSCTRGVLDSRYKHSGMTEIWRFLACSESLRE